MGNEQIKNVLDIIAKDMGSKQCNNYKNTSLIKFMSAGFETKSSDSKKRNRRQPHPQKVASIEAIQKSIVDNFGEIKDPRVERTKKHQLTDILVIAILTVIGGAQGLEDIENYGLDSLKPFCQA